MILEFFNLVFDLVFNRILSHLLFLLCMNKAWPAELRESRFQTYLIRAKKILGIALSYFVPRDRLAAQMSGFWIPQVTRRAHIPKIYHLEE